MIEASNGTWVELGTNCMIRVDRITAVTMQDEKLRVHLDGVEAPLILVQPSHEDAQRHYLFLSRLFGIRRLP